MCVTALCRNAIQVLCASLSKTKYYAIILLSVFPLFFLFSFCRYFFMFKVGCGTFHFALTVFLFIYVPSSSSSFLSFLAFLSFLRLAFHVFVLNSPRYFNICLIPLFRIYRFTVGLFNIAYPTFWQFMRELFRIHLVWFEC